jgi:transcriptional regulator with XRE-family HTH domain
LLVLKALVQIAYVVIVVKPAQVRMARAALNWSLQDLAKASGVHRNTISNYETGKYGGSEEALSAVRAALEAAGIEFTNGEAPGVRMRRKTDEREGNSRR